MLTLDYSNITLHFCLQHPEFKVSPSDFEFRVLQTKVKCYFFSIDITLSPPPILLFMTLSILIYNTFHCPLGKSTVFEQKWRKEREAEEATDFNSTYKSSFETQPRQAMVFKHYATKKPVSSHFHAHTVNKNLAMRNVNVNLAPEFSPTVAEQIVS